jgi:hypothetical protein
MTADSCAVPGCSGGGLTPDLAIRFAIAVTLEVEAEVEYDIFAEIREKLNSGPELQQVCAFSLVFPTLSDSHINDRTVRKNSCGHERGIIPPCDPDSAQKAAQEFRHP